MGEIEDEKADQIIRSMMLQVAATALLPAAVNWAFLMTLMSFGVARISRIYGFSLNKEEGWKVVKQLFLAAGSTWMALNIGSKFLFALIQTTGIGYFVTVALDVTISVAMAYAIGGAAKVYFKGEHGQKELGHVVRDLFKEGKKEYTADKLIQMRKEEKTVSFSYEKLLDLFSDKKRMLIVNDILMKNTQTATELINYMSHKGINSIDELTIYDLQELDNQGGLSHEIWDIISQEINMDDFVNKKKITPLLPITYKNALYLGTLPALLGLTAKFNYSLELVNTPLSVFLNNLKTLPPENITSLLNACPNLSQCMKNNVFVKAGFTSPEDAFIQELSRLSYQAEELGISGETVKSSIDMAIDLNPDFDEIFGQIGDSFPDIGDFFGFI